MKLNVAAIILFSLVATSFAAPIPKNKVVQNLQLCSAKCQNNFALCAQLRIPPTPPPTVGTQQVAPPAPLVVGPNCEGELNLCFMRCQANPRG
jgi:hypothetical protein